MLNANRDLKKSMDFEKFVSNTFRRKGLEKGQGEESVTIKRANGQILLMEEIFEHRKGSKVKR